MNFDVVVGSSIGAIMSTHAYLASRSDSLSTPEMLKNFFLNHGRNDWYRKRSLLSKLLKPTSVYSTGPLRTQLQRLITRPIYRQVIDEVKIQPHRRIFVSTIDMDEGILQIWDLTRIAEMYGEDGYEHYLDVLIAAGAVPLMFPARFTDGVGIYTEPISGQRLSMLVDGGFTRSGFSS